MCDDKAARGGVERGRYTGVNLGSRVTRKKPPRTAGHVPVWGFAVFSGLWVFGSYQYMMWSERAGKDIRQKGIIKDIVREERRLQACKDCTSDDLIKQLQDDGFAKKWKEEHLRDIDEDEV